jgi:3-oxoacid CoA-transferase subunit B
MIPGTKVKGPGGAMDLAVGAKRVFVTMEHVSRKEGKPPKMKILKKCALPLTGLKCVNHIVTDYAFIDVTPEGLVLRELAPGVTVAQVQELTEPRLKVAPDVREMKL